MTNNILHSTGSFVCRIGLAGVALAFAFITGCSNDRTIPTASSEPAYTNTYVLINDQPAAGVELDGTFNVRDSVTNARLQITCMFTAETGTKVGAVITPTWTDPVMHNYFQRKADLAAVDADILALDAAITDIKIMRNPTHADTLRMDSLETVKGSKLETKEVFQNKLDSLDTRLDDRFKLAIRLDADAGVQYPYAVILDPSVSGSWLAAGDTTVWGQGFYLAPLDTVWNSDRSAYNIHGGKTFKLSLQNFLVADQTYRPPVKPARPAAISDLPELLPMNTWLARLTPGSHTLHFKFATTGTVSSVTATIHVVYATEG